jgi:hypothetical protein
LAKWIEIKLSIPTTLANSQGGRELTGVEGLTISFGSENLSISRKAQEGHISQPDSPSSSVYLPQRSDLDCLVEDLRFLGEDDGYAEVLRSITK